MKGAIILEDYKSNSHKSKAEAKAQVPEKKVEKVVNGPVKVKKKNEVSKLKDVFISEDAANVKSYVIMDVVIPTIQKAIVDIVSDGIRMIFGQGHDSRRSRSSDGPVSYRSYYDKHDDDRRYGRSSSRTRGSYSYDDIIFDSRGEAERVLERMEDLLDQYKLVTVADLYEMVDVPGEWTDNKYGWTSLRTAEAVRVRDGYMLKLPKAFPID